MNEKLQRIKDNLNNDNYMQNAIKCIAIDCVQQLSPGKKFIVEPPTSQELNYLYNKAKSAGFRPHFITSEKKNRIIEMRRNNPGMFLREIAAACGVSLSAVSKILRGAE